MRALGTNIVNKTAFLVPPIAVKNVIVFSYTYFIIHNIVILDTFKCPSVYISIYSVYISIYFIFYSFVLFFYFVTVNYIFLLTI